MKFSKHQKQTIRLIASRKIFDIQSYLQYFGYGNVVKYDKKTVDEKFSKKCAEKTFYQAKNINPSKNSTMSRIEFNDGVRANKVSPSEYNECHLKINYDYGIQNVFWKDQCYTFDFYEGVYVVNTFEKILEFLILWEYLKSQMLIFELNDQNEKNNIGLLFYKQDKNSTISENPKIVIDYSTLTVSDAFFIDDSLYKFSDENLCICDDFLNKKIIPSASLNLFIKNKFKSQEERIQIKALGVAWIAIFVSIILSFLPFLLEKNEAKKNEIYISLCEDVSEIKKDISNFIIEQKNFNKESMKHWFFDETKKDDSIYSESTKSNDSSE